MEFIKILFNIAFTVLPLLLLLLLQIPAARATTRSSTENNNNNHNIQNAETTTIATTIITTTPTTTATTTNNNKNKNNISTTISIGELRKHEQIIDNSIDFTVDPCDDFYQYACGEWKQQLYHQHHHHYNIADHTEDKSSDGEERKAEQTVKYDNDDDDAQSDKYDRTLAMIDYLADKEVLKYFNKRNMTKNLNTTTTARTQATTTAPTTKEPDFIIKVYKYYKSCIAIQQYEPIKYLEWLELNEHVKWPSLINTTTTATATTATNSEEHQTNKHDHNADTEGEEDDEIVMDADDDDDDDEVDETKTADEMNDEAAQDYDSSWIITLAKLRKYGMNGIFIEEIIYNTKSFPTKMLLGFNKPTKEGGFKSMKNEHLKIILNNLNLKLSADSYKKLWLQVTKFEWQLTKLNDLSDELGTTMITIAYLPVPWLSDYLKVIFNQTRPLDANMRIVITNVAYFMALDDLLNEYDDNFLNQYLQMRFLWHLYQQEPQHFQPLECIQHIKSFIPLAFDWIYEKQNDYLKPEIPKINVMFNNLRRQFNLTLYNNRNNFDSATLDQLVKKLESIQLYVGSFVDIDGSEFFYENRKFYSSLKLSSAEYYFNHLKMLKFNFEALHFGMQGVSTHSRYYDMQEYNRGLSSAPYFNQRLNTLNIPLSLLRPPLYHKDFTDIYKYSSLGFLIGQTLMYGFNLNGLAKEEHTTKLMQQVKCLGSWQSTEFNDKIADTSGLRLSYHSFFHSHNNNLISNRKKFFLNYAQTFCGSHNSDEALGRSHVNYALAQFAEFAKTFECSPDSHMNPHEKCYLWD
ncbi:neprilysin-4-like [Lucilia cuprina]|uniref:neprilysin-4-like n=1 Tax=Lucilia cuprina TaxID=7375 RepID=UPI001F063C52|nr:neprilysin-4-like [Lucilia cuprina]